MVLLPARTPGDRCRREHLFAVVVSVLALGLTACGGSAAGPDDPAGSRDPNTVAPPSASATSPSRASTGPPAAADGTDTDACFDGRCEVALAAPTVIRLDGELGVGRVSVTEIAGDGVTVSCAWETAWQDGDRSGAGAGASVAVMAEGNVLPCRGLQLRLAALADGTAVLALSPV